MTTDINGRRLPWSERIPKKNLFVFNEADYRAFELMDAHGWLPSSYLYEGTKHLRADETQTKNRLRDFYDGSITQGYFLERHQEQFAQHNAHARHTVTGNAPKAVALLESLGRKCEVPPTSSAWFKHQLFQGCVGATFELCVPEGFTYISRSELLTSDKCGKALGKINPMTIPHGKGFTPDDLFALEREGKRRYFLIEIDRATESMSGETGATYFSHKLDTYQTLYKSGMFREWYGFNRPNLLVITTNETRAKKINKLFTKFDESLHDRLFVTHEPSFGANWRVPKELFRHLYDRPWFTPKGERHITD